MKYIVPLFRQNTGRVNLGLVNWDSFQAGFRMVMRGDKFAGVTWDPWWRERNPGDRRKEQQRTIPERRSHGSDGRRLSREGDSVQPLRLVHGRRTNWKRRSGSDRRESTSRDRLVGLAAFIPELGKGVLSDENTRLLIRMWAALTTRETYETWKQISGMTPFFKELDWNEKENHEKFTEYAVASFLDLLRPGVIYWKGQSPNLDNMRAVSRIASVFVRATPKAILQAVRAFIEGKVELEGMRKTLGGESLTDKKELLQLVWSNRKLKPKAFYEKLRGQLSDLGIELSPKPDNYRKQIERHKKDAELYMACLSR